MRILIKLLLNKLAQLVTLPIALTCWAEYTLNRNSEVVFSFWTNVFALIPGLPGVFLRRGFYSLTLEQCSTNCHIGFGSMFCHRSAIVEEKVYLGNYCTIGSAHLGKNCLIGSRASLLSGSEQHVYNDESGEWSSFTQAGMRQIHIGANAWVGEAAIIMANVGEGTQVAAGAVISSDTRAHVVVAGNPARFIKNLPVSKPYSEQDIALDTASKEVSSHVGTK